MTDLPPYETYSFINQASRPKNAVALIYDLEGFSRFFNQPDVQEYVPQFINIVSASIASIINGGDTFWCPSGVQDGALLQPVHEKFLGDGGLYIFTPAKGELTFPDEFLMHLCNRLWNLKSNFDAVISACADEVPVFELPRRIRFGLARGTVYELMKETGETEYIGFCINLASRLQSYCNALGFISSARMNLPDSVLAEHDFMKVVATKLRGFSKEIVIVDKDEFENLNGDTREELFQPLPQR